MLSTLNAPIITFERSLQDRAREEWSLKINRRERQGRGQGTTEGQRIFHPAEVDSNLGGVAIFSDKIDDRRLLSSYGVRSTPGADKFGVGTISFVAWAVDQYLLTRFKTGK